MRVHRKLWLFSALICIFGAKLGVAEDKPWLGSFQAKRVVTASSPDNTYNLLVGLFDSAHVSIDSFVYQLDNVAVGQALERAIQRGVKVRLLVEGAPIPKVPMAELFIAARLVDAGAKVYFYDSEKGRSNRTFKYVHAKYSIVDSSRVAVGSANYGNSGHPLERSTGNREWEVILDDPQAARLFGAAFAHDFELKQEWVSYGARPKYTLPDPDYKPENPRRRGRYELSLKPIEAKMVPVKTVFAPDNGLEALSNAIRSAGRTIDIEQLTFETFWGDKPYNPDREESPFTSLLLSAARAGRTIRVLLNDETVFFDPKMFGVLDIFTSWFSPTKPPRDNNATLERLNDIAHREGLSLEARLLNFKACGLQVLHNKGMIVDDEVTFVGSLNWGESAIKFNREAGVLLKDRSVANYYSQAFDYDWNCSDARQ